MKNPPRERGHHHFCGACRRWRDPAPSSGYVATTDVAFIKER